MLKHVKLENQKILWIFDQIEPIFTHYKTLPNRIIDSGVDKLPNFRIRIQLRSRPRRGHIHESSKRQLLAGHFEF